LSKLRENAPLTAAWERLLVDAQKAPERYLTRLCEHSARDRWELGQMDWAAVDLTSIPLPLREAGAMVLTQLQFGELTAMLGAAKLVEMAPAADVQAFAARQVEEESRHLMWFSRVIGKLECVGTVSDHVVELMTDVYESTTPEALTLGVNILVEGMAHSYFVRAAKMFRDVELQAFAPARVVASEWLPEYLGRDEARHIAFGVGFLRERLSNMSSEKRAALERDVERWSSLLGAAARANDVFVVPGMDGMRVVDELVEDVNLRLSQIGLESRLDLPTKATAR
jgi:hypothetical protein